MESESPGGTLLILEPKSLRSFTTNDEYLYAMKEDLADWFACLYKIQIEADTFLTILETGVILCRHANEVQHFFNERRRQLQQQQPDGGSQSALPPLPALAMRSYFIRNVPEGTVTFRLDVKPGTFQARDNVSNFITWCRHLGIPDVLRFETDDLVMRKNEKSVILCLLELARVGAKLGMLAPTIVQMEQEIDEELESGEPPPAATTHRQQIKTCDMKSLDELVRELVGQCSCPVQFPMVKIGEGKYQIGDSKTLIFVRVLRNHVMVRVGGGWDTLENYLDKHDPCRCQFRGHRGGGGGSAGPRHQIIRRASTSALIATRSPAAAGTATNNNSNQNQNPTQTSPRRMSSVHPPPSSMSGSASSHGISTTTKGPASGPGAHTTSGGGGFVKGSSPGPGGGFAKGSSPAPGSSSSSSSSSNNNRGQQGLHSRSASPSTPGFAKGPSPIRCASPGPAPGANGVRRLGGVHITTTPASSSSSSTPSPASSQNLLRESQQSLRGSTEILWESRESSSSHSSAGGGGGGGGGGRHQQQQQHPHHHHRPSSPSVSNNNSQSLSHQQQRQPQQQQQQHHQQQQQQPPQQPLPQHQAVQRCKSPSPGPRCVSPAMSGNRTLPRPISRGASGIPRPQSPAVAGATNNNNSSSSSSNGQAGRSSSASGGGHGARRQLFSNMARSASFDAPSRTDGDSYYSYYSSDNHSDGMAATENLSDNNIASRDGPEGQGHGQGQDEGVSDANAAKEALDIDQISTMTLSEFKKLISSNLSVPQTPEEEGGGGGGGATRGGGGGAQPYDSPRFQRKGVAGQMKRSQSAEASQQGNNGAAGLSWSSVRDKARSVCNSLASNASSRRSGSGTASNIIARRNLPKTPANSAPSSSSSCTSTDFARPKTPSTDRPPTAPSSPAVGRSKTPVATSSGYGYRPKTPTSIGEGAQQQQTPNNRARPKTPTSIREGVQQTPTRPTTLGRPKTPTSMGGGYARAGGFSSPSTPTPSSSASSSVAGFGGRSGEFARPRTPSRDVVGEPRRPKTPTSLSGGSSRAPAVAAEPVINPRVKITSVVSPADDVEVAEACLRVKTSSFVYTEDPADSSNNNNDNNNAAEEAASRYNNNNNSSNDTFRPGMGVRSATWASSPSNNNNYYTTAMDNNNDYDDSSGRRSLSQIRQRSQSPADDLDGDNSEIAEAMSSMTSTAASSGSGSSLAASLRDRPSTPSRIPKPTFTRSATPTGPAGEAAARSKSAIPTGRSTPVAQSQQSASRPQQPRAASSTNPAGRSSLERAMTAPENIGDIAWAEKPPPSTPRRQQQQQAAQVPRCATPSSSKSYTEMFHARRSQTPGPGSSGSSTTTASTATARPTTPGPGTSTGGLRGGSSQQQKQQQQQQSAGRRGSLGRVLGDGGSHPLRKARSVTNLLQDYEKLSVVDSGDVNRRGGGRGGDGSLEAQRRLQRQNACDADRDVTPRGRRGAQVTDNNRNNNNNVVTYTPRAATAALSRVSQSASFDNSNERVRSKTPGPGIGNGGCGGGGGGGSRYTQQPRGIIRKPKIGDGGPGGNRAINRTEAWVDSTLNDPKRKQTPPRPRRAMTPNSLAIAESELKSRPLEEIQAALSSPSPLGADPVAVVAPPPEDPDMFRKMEQLFEKYREMELRASVYDTPGGEYHHSNDNSNVPANNAIVATTSSGSNNSSSVGRSTSNGGGSRPGGQVCQNSASSSLRSSMTHSGSFSSGLSSSARSHQDTGSGSYSSRGPSVDSDRFSKESSPAAAASSSYCSNGAAGYSGNGDVVLTNQLVMNGSGDDSGCVTSVVVTPRPGQQQGAPAVSADDIVDLDPETLATDPTALVSKIKEILQVRPRKDTAAKGGGVRTRIPAPAPTPTPLARTKRSKSVSSLTNGETMSVFHADHSPPYHSSSSTTTTTVTPNGLMVDVTRDESTNSDVSSDYSRCETPVPKLTQPLTTGRSTLFRRGGGGGSGDGRSLSQDDHVSSSSSLSSSSRRYWDEDGEYV